MILKNIYNGIKQRIIRVIFHYVTKDVFLLPSIESFSEQNNVALVSMLQEADVQMYLLAAQSMLRYMTINKVIIICDPSLTDASKSLLKRYLAHIEFLDAINFRHTDIPLGGCWERLYAISHLTKDYFVIQMDADILVLKSPKEVIAATKLNYPFILGTNPNYQQLSIAEMSAVTRQWSKEFTAQSISPHIQVIVESHMDNLAKQLGFTRYTRGCAGFAGFSKESITPELVLKASQLFYAEFGEQWAHWGTEQFMSNLLLSNIDNVLVLPTEKYNSSDKYTDDFVLAHFIGTYRFSNMSYIRLARKFLIEISHNCQNNSLSM